MESFCLDRREEKVDVLTFDMQWLFRGLDKCSNSVVTENTVNSFWSKSLVSTVKHCVESEVWDVVEITSLS
jgi:hypothetical protein